LPPAPDQSSPVKDKDVVTEGEQKPLEALKPDSPADDDDGDSLRVRVPFAGHIAKVAGWQSRRDDDGDDDNDDDDVVILPSQDEPIPAEPLKAKRILIASNGNSKTDVNELLFKIANARPTLHSGQRVVLKLALPGSAALKPVVPYSAVVYGANGDAYVYTTTEPLVYVRQRVVIESIEKDKAILTEGPPSGTQVVTAGAAELFGAETGVGH
jgi:multidrug efflux pump subunit AcrA (membrane-fusion protein)